MKKWFAGVLIVALLLLASLYVFIPNVVALKSDISIKVTQQGLYRMLLDNNNVKAITKTKLYFLKFESMVYFLFINSLQNHK